MCVLHSVPKVCYDTDNEGNPPAFKTKLKIYGGTQHENRCYLRQWKGGSSDCQGGRGASVSYTHLDVYKRQVQLPDERRIRVAEQALGAPSAQLGVDVAQPDLLAFPEASGLISRKIRVVLAVIGRIEIDEGFPVRAFYRLSLIHI